MHNECLGAIVEYGLPQIQDKGGHSTPSWQDEKLQAAQNHAVGNEGRGQQYLFCRLSEESLELPNVCLFSQFITPKPHAESLFNTEH